MIDSRLPHRDAQSLLVETDADPVIVVTSLGRRHGRRRREPVTLGLPCPRGWLRADDRVEVVSARHERLATQARTLETWTDGSARWLLVDFLADADGGAEATYTLTRSGAGAVIAAGPALVCGGGQAVLEFDGTRFVLGADGSLTARGEPSTIRVELTDPRDRRLDLHATRFECEESGPLRTVVRVDGAAVAPAGVVLDLSIRYQLFAGGTLVRAVVTLRNPRRARHPGGYWDLGDPGSVYLKDASIVVDLAGSDVGQQAVVCSAERDAALEPCGVPFELYQDSSGGDNWQSSNHMNRLGQLPVRFRGYRLRQASGERTGLRASPVVGLRGGGREVTLAQEHFWQRFPKAVEARPGLLRLRLLPQQWADVHEIQAGEEFTETVTVALAADTISDPPLDWVRHPLRARLEPAWYCAVGALPHLVPAADDLNRGYLGLVNAAIEGDDTFERKRERIDEYGWRNFGDIYADHETVGSPQPLVSHYNNQYDAIAGFACQFFRSGDLRWLTAMDELARHVMDIDIYHTAVDKPAYNGGLFWHTFHYIDAGLATHRTYPAASRVGGGGPSAEHNYNTGLMLHYFLTGDRRARDAAIGLARWVVDMDDPALTPLRWLSRRPTGLASATGSFDYHGPGRGPGNGVVVLLNAFRLAGDRRYLEKAEELIARCSHPADDIPRLNLLDAERRWYYTVFLQAIGKYLALKQDLDARDRHYQRARATLLHYARWMEAHEYPYLEKPEILEYPTETWAAQDVRKTEVFQLAAIYAETAEEARRFLERARFFFDYAISALTAAPTRTLARPVVLLLSNGFSRAFFANGLDAASIVSANVSDIRQFGLPRPFVPQRIAARRHAGVLLIGVTAAAAALIGWLLTSS